MRDRRLGVLSLNGQLQGWLVSGRSEGVPKVFEIVNLMLVDGGNDVAILEASDGGRGDRRVFFVGEDRYNRWFSVGDQPVKCQGDDKKEKEWNCEEAKEEGTLLCCAHTRHGPSSTRVRPIVAQLLSG